MATAAETLQQGWRIHQSGDFAGAERMYRAVLQADANNANAWCYLGIACYDQDRFDEAVASYQRAIQIQPQFPIAYNNLGNTLRMQKRLTEALACFDEALRQQPGYVNAHKNKGTALVWEGRLDEALESYGQALQLAPEDAETHKNLGVIRLLKGQFAEGWREYRWRWRTKEMTPPKYDRPQWDGSSLDGKTILLVAEQGLGDTIHFIRYGGVLKQRYTCRVVVACHRPLLALMADCSGLDALVAIDEPPPAFDVFCPLLDVPGVLGEDLQRTPGQVPYLSARPELVEQWRERLSVYGGLKIGIAWQGNPKYPADRMRSFPLSALEPLGRLHGIQLFSLQRDAGVEQLDALAGRLDIVPLGQELDRTTGAFVETAAVLKNLDLVITPDTAVAHVAGALGVPLWLALSNVPHWPWLLDREDTPWYPTARLFRQHAGADWTSVFERMAEQLVADKPAVRPKEFAEFRVADCGANRLTRTRHGLMIYNRHDSYIGRSVERYGEFSEGECDLLRQMVRPGQVVVEAGANIGAHTLVLSQLVGPAGRVYAFEPQRVVFQILCGNLALNGCLNVVCREMALGDQPGQLRVPPVDYQRENNFGGVALRRDDAGEPVPVITLDSLDLPACHFLKADVEGMELSVLRGAEQTLRRHRPLLYVENDRQASSAALIEYLQSLEYDLYWHLPPLFNPRNHFRNGQNEFPNIVSANMLGVHRSINASIEGLRRVEGPHSNWQVPDPATSG
jgi:FkbM family methyltransferase